MLTHTFDDGSVLYRAADKATFYLPDAMAQLFAILQRSDEGLSESEMVDILLGAGWSGEQINSAIEALASQQLIARF